MQAGEQAGAQQAYAGEQAVAHLPLLQAGAHLQLQLQTDDADVLLLRLVDVVGIEYLCGAAGWLPSVHAVCHQLLQARGLVVGSAVCVAESAAAG